MVTESHDLTTSWPEIATSECVISSDSFGVVYIKYADSAPTAGDFSASHHVSDTAPRAWPAPASGSIYAATSNSGGATITVTEV